MLKQARLALSCEAISRIKGSEMFAFIILAAATVIITPKGSFAGGVIIECGDGGGITNSADGKSLISS